MEFLSAGLSALGGMFASGSSDDAMNAQLQAIAQARQEADQGYTADQGFISQYGNQAQSALNNGFASATNEYMPLVQQGDKARAIYDNATGVNGASAKSAYQQQLFQEPIYQAGLDRATQAASAASADGGLGSGPLARALNRDTIAFGNQYVGQDLSRLQPSVQEGDKARTTLAGLNVDQGKANANQAWGMGDRSINARDNLTNAYMGASLSSGRAQANNAINQGNIFQSTLSGIGQGLSGMGQGGDPSLGDTFSLFA